MWVFYLVEVGADANTGGEISPFPPGFSVGFDAGV